MEISSNFLRGEAPDLEGVKDKKLRGQLYVKEKFFGQSAQTAASYDKWLLPSVGGYLEAEGLQKSWNIKQEDIAREVDILSARNLYDIVLPDLGPYIIDFTSSGRHSAVAGRKGHLAIVDMQNMNLIRELQVKETLRDVVFLHNEQFFAAAQKKYTYIYHSDGTELHCLKEHGPVLKLQFLKNHFLLASINKSGHLHYQDTTTGEMVGNYRTGVGRTNLMQVNPINGVLGLGHSSGTVTMWRPTTASRLVKMLCHPGPIRAMAFHPNGNIMATSGAEGKIKIWDLRKFQLLQDLPGQAKTLDFSQKGMLAVGTGSHTQIYSNSKSDKYNKYMGHDMAKGYQIANLKFRPYEDVLGIGHSMGWSSILIPGSGEPNFDSWVANPYETNKQRREKEIHLLLDKLPPETIMMDPRKIGTIWTGRRKEKKTKQEKEADKEAAVEAAKGIKMKKKTKGRSKPSKVASKKQDNVVKAKRAFVDDDIQEKSAKKQNLGEGNSEVSLPVALRRFASNKFQG